MPGASVTMREAARMCGVEAATVRRWLAADRTPLLRSAEGPRVLRRDLRGCARRRGLPEPPGLLSGPSVLVVEDEPGLGLLVAGILRRLWRNAAVRTCADGLRAARRIRENPPDLLVADLRLPGMSGVDLCRMAREERGLERMKVLAMTGYHTARVNRRTLESGADEYLRKPFTPDELRLSAVRLLGLGPLGSLAGCRAPCPACRADYRRRGLDGAGAPAEEPPEPPGEGP